MAFLLAQDPNEQGSIAQQMKRFGHKLPERFIEPPELLPGLGIYLDAFFDLDSERQTVEGPLPIKWSSIIDYARAYSFTVEESDELLFIIKRMDSEHLKRIAPKKDGK